MLHAPALEVGALGGAMSTSSVLVVRPESKRPMRETAGSTPGSSGYARAPAAAVLTITLGVTTRSRVDGKGDNGPEQTASGQARWPVWADGKWASAAAGLAGDQQGGMRSTPFVSRK